MNINNLLYSVRNMAPALLNTGGNKTQNYDNLAGLNSLWGDSSSIFPGLGGTEGGGPADTVTLAYKNIGDQIVTDMAALTAGAIKDYPDLDNDYVIALIDNGNGREARVFRRSEILAGFEGSEEDKKALAEQLELNPLLVFDEADKLPVSSADPACQSLAADLNNFLKTADKTLNSLNKAGYDPLAELIASGAIKDLLAKAATALPFGVAEEVDFA